MLLAPTDNPGNNILMGSIFTDGGCSLFTDRGRSLFTDGGRSHFTDGGSLFTEEDKMLPPYLGVGHRFRMHGYPAAILQHHMRQGRVVLVMGAR
jgi:hypothetical protein